jgi:hypothetical protein
MRGPLVSCLPSRVKTTPWVNNQFHLRGFQMFHSTGRQKVMLALCLAVCVSAPKLWAQESKGTLIEFDAPDAGTVNSSECAPTCGTQPYDNNDLGVIVGEYTDANIVPHGFLRTPDGQLTSFDAPGAGLGYGLNQGTFPYAINDLGVIAGQFQDSNYVFHGFVRYPNDSFTTFDDPNAGTEANQGTLAWDINLGGTTAGSYIDANNVQHGFVRSTANKFTSIDPTGSVFTFVCRETCLNPEDTVTGYFTDSGGVTHGFVRQANGTITSFDAPAPAPLTTIETVATSINPQGVIAGYYFDSNLTAHGFLRDRDGSFTTFDDPDAGAGTIQVPSPIASTSREQPQVYSLTRVTTFMGSNDSPMGDSPTSMLRTRTRVSLSARDRRPTALKGRSPDGTLMPVASTTASSGSREPDRQELRSGLT